VFHTERWRNCRARRRPGRFRGREFWSGRSYAASAWAGYLGRPPRQSRASGRPMRGRIRRNRPGISSNPAIALNRKSGSSGVPGREIFVRSPLRSPPLNCRLPFTRACCRPPLRRARLRCTSP